MHPPKQVAVVGAGAAGLTAAIAAAKSGAQVTLLNAHPRIGLKILMSGGTRCNVTHREVGERDYFGGSRRFVARVLRAFPVERTLEWLEEMGVELKLEDTGKYFPVTDDADTVLQALLRDANRAGVTIEHGARVVRLERVDPEPVVPANGEAQERATAEGMPEPPEPAPRYRVGIQTVKNAAVFEAGTAPRRGEAQWRLPGVAPDRWLEADAVILASGGLSFPRTGSDGVGYALATALGHTLEPPIPALTPLAAEDALCRVAQGITLDVELSLWVEGKRTERVKGSMVIAHFGYSGPAALDLSRHWLRAHGERRVTVNFAVGETLESLRAAWVDATKTAPERTVRRHLARWVPERLGERLAEEAGVDPSAQVAQVKRERREALMSSVVARDIKVTGTLGYEKAEVTAGGVRVEEVDPATLESRVSPGLFLCGEILDVEGRLGGFNFQWAWSSGTVAGKSAAR